MTPLTLPGLPELRAGTLYCIGRNYSGHAIELNNPIPSQPVIFIKPLTSLTFDGIIHIPSFVAEPHFETEIVVALGQQVKNITAGKALTAVAGYGIGIDVTSRDIQQQLKEKRHPWFLAKGLDTFAPVSSFIPAEQIPDPGNLSFNLDINGVRKQNGRTSLMLFPVAEIISILSKFVTLYPGDLIFTGTPEGVGLLQDGDLLHANLGTGLVTLEARVERDT
ncbi:MAG: fumarylacetoacetate hydrolase family protein [Balneolales bacterium]